MNYEITSKRPLLVSFLSPLFSMFVSRTFLSYSSEAKSEFNAEVNQSYETYVMVYILAVSLGEKTF